jgi:hypothetical protein
MKTDWLLAVGCSLTWGSEITQFGESLLEDKTLAWPAHLGKLLNVSQLTNRGWPGRSNGSIFRIAMEEMASHAANYGTDGMVVIQWSGPARLEIVNPYEINIRSLYRQKYHPGQEPGPYHSFTPMEVSDKNIQNKFPHLADYFFRHWTHDFYQLELLVNYSVALTSVANSLGIKILQFNGIDELNFDILPPHSQDISGLIGKEYYRPFDRSSAFWPASCHFPRDNIFNIVPRHPTAEQHEKWANILYNYMLEIQSARLE